MILLTLLACWREPVAELKTDLTTVDKDVESVDDRVAALEARLASTEARLAMAEAELATAADDIEDHEARIVELEDRADQVEEDVLNLSGNLFSNDLYDQEQDRAIADLSDALAELGGGSGAGGLTMATASQAYNSTYNVGSSATWLSIVSDLPLTLDVAGPVIAWCTATSSSSQAMFRVRIESADGSWSATGEEVNDGGGYNQYWSSSYETFTAMGAFNAPAGGDYTVSCEGNGQNGLLNINFVALAG